MRAVSSSGKRRRPRSFDICEEMSSLSSNGGNRGHRSTESDSPRSLPHWLWHSMQTFTALHGTKTRRFLRRTAQERQGVRTRVYWKRREMASLHPPSFLPRRVLHLRPFFELEIRIGGSCYLKLSRCLDEAFQVYQITIFASCVFLQFLYT